jgi:hypothetical protein
LVVVAVVAVAFLLGLAMPEAAAAVADVPIFHDYSFQPFACPIAYMY